LILHYISRFIYLPEINLVYKSMLRLDASCYQQRLKVTIEDTTNLD